jgi:hypothetical protein
MNIVKSFATLLVAGGAALSIAAPKTIILQQGLDGFTGCTDNELRSPAQNYGNGPVEKTMKVSEL